VRRETAAEDLDQLLVARPRRAVFPGDKQQAAERGGIEHLTVETARGVDQGFVGSECSIWNAISPYRGEAFLRGAGEGPECGYPRLLVRSDTQTSLETVEQDLAAQMERVSRRRGQIPLELNEAAILDQPTLREELEGPAVRLQLPPHVGRLVDVAKSMMGAFMQIEEKPTRFG
jgi:hypothetical protein